MLKWTDHFFRPWLQRLYSSLQPATYPWRMATAKGEPFAGQEWLEHLNQGPILLQGPDALLIADNMVHTLLRAENAPYIPCYLPQSEQFSESTDHALGGNFYTVLKTQLNHCFSEQLLFQLCISTHTPLLLLIETNSQLTKWLNPLQELLSHCKAAHKLILLDPKIAYKPDDFGPLLPLAIQIRLFDAQSTVPELLKTHPDWLTSWKQVADAIPRVTALQIEHLKSALLQDNLSAETELPLWLAEWQALLNGRLNAYRHYLTALRDYLERHRPQFFSAAMGMEENFVEVFLQEASTKEEPSNQQQEDALYAAGKEAKVENAPEPVAVPITGLPQALINQKKPFVVQGGPGAGKSMLLRHMTLQLAYRNAEQMPVYLNLRSLENLNLSEEMQQWKYTLWEYLRT